METKQKVLFYIPAKGSSRGIPRKNLAPLLGVPLLTYSLLAALEVAEQPQHVIVSSEAEEIGELAKAYGATHLRRRPELAKDEARVREVLAEELDQLEALAGRDAVVVVLLPTSPLRNADHIRAGLAAFLAKPEAFSLVSVTEFPVAPVHALLFASDGLTVTYPHGIEMFNQNSRRQTVTTPFYPNGALYIVRLRDFAGYPFLYHPSRTIGFVMDAVSGIDVDNAETLELVAAAMRFRQRSEFNTNESGSSAWERL